MAMGRIRGLRNPAFEIAMFDIVTLKPKLTITPEESVALSVKEYAPACVGVPLIIPPAETVNPGGRPEPGATDHVTVDPASKLASTCEYGTPTDPFTRAVFVSTVNGATVKV